MRTTLLRYYRSVHWRQHPARSDAFERAGHRCQTCNSLEQLELHHRYYPDVLGTETIDALTVLCRACHRAITARIRQARYQRRLVQVPDTLRVQPGSIPREKDISYVSYDYLSDHRRRTPADACHALGRSDRPDYQSYQKDYQQKGQNRR